MDEQQHSSSTRPFATDELQPLVVSVPASVAAGEAPLASFSAGTAGSASLAGRYDDDTSSSGSHDDNGEGDDELNDSKHKRRKRRRPKHLRSSPPESTAPTPRIPDFPWVHLVVLLVAMICAGGGALWYKESGGAPRGPRGPPAPLWLTTHDTRSAPLDVHSAMARPLVAYLDDALGTLLDPRHYPCLCMHHVNAGAVSNQLYQVCSTTQIAGPLVNPTLVGRGNETDHWSESSVACQTLERGQRRARYRTIWLHWHDVPTGQQMFGRFDGAVAACLQLAMDEMTLGNKICVN